MGRHGMGHFTWRGWAARRQLRTWLQCCLLGVSLYALAGCDGDDGMDAGMDADMDAGPNADGSAFDAGPSGEDAGLDADSPPPNDASPMRDSDRDGDGVPDHEDAFPDDPTEHADPDEDGLGAFADPDEDNDGTPDAEDGAPLDPTRSEAYVYDEGEFNDATPSVSRPGLFPVIIEGELGPADDDLIAISDVPPGRYTVWVEGIEQAAILRVDLGAFAMRTIPRDATGYMENYEVEETRSMVIRLEDVRRFNGSPRAYRLHVFEDVDADGLDDDRETALGLIAGRTDFDQDGLSDRVELAHPDIDGDGIPNWLDHDSDGDGVSDRIDGRADEDGDGLPGFLDSDSDGDGVGDLEGVSRGDTDSDGVADFRDPDDDNDGIPDAHDTEPHTPLPVADLTSVHIDRVYSEASGHELVGWARAGDTLIVEGAGFGTEPRVLFDGRVSSIPTPTVATDTEIRVPVPPGATGGIRILRSADRSTRLDVQLAEADAPLILPLAAPLGPTASTGRTAVDGENLGDLLDARVSGTLVGIWGATEDRVELQFSGGYRAGQLQVRTPAGWSNPIYVRSAQGILGNLTLPAGFGPPPESLRVYSSLGDDPMVVNGSGSFFGDVARYEPEVLTVVLPSAGAEPDSTVLMQLLLVDDVVAPTTETTALAWVMTGALRFPDWDPSALESIRDELAATPELTALTAAIDAALIEDARAFTSPPPALTDALLAAVNATGPIVARHTPIALPGGTIRVVSPGSIGDVTVRHPDDDPGGVEIVNNTQVYLSAELTRRRDDRILVAHADGPFGASVIGAQDTLLTAFSANVRTYRAPSGSNADLVVLSGGFEGPGPVGPEERAVVRMLVLRTLLDKIVLPVFGAVIGGRFSDDSVKHTIINLIATNAVPGAEALWAAIDAGDPTAVAVALGAILRNDATGVGPIIQAVAKGLGALAKRLAARLIPVVGALDAVLQGAGLLVAGVNVAAALSDIATTRTRMTFDVTYDFELDDALPDPLSEADLDGAREFTLRGRGFGPTYDDSGALTHPRISFVPDTGDLAAVTTPDYILSDGTIAQVEAPIEVMRAVRDELTIRVQPAPDEPEQTLRIPVVHELRISQAAPPVVRPGQTVTLLGSGFGQSLRDREIRLRSGDTRLTARPTDVSEHRITFIMPAAAREGVWETSVVIGPVGFTESSNAVPLTVSGQGHVGVWVVSTRYDPSPHDAFYNANTGECGRWGDDLTPDDIARFWTVGIHPDGRVYWNSCGTDDRNVERCRRGLNLNGQPYLGTWTLSPEGSLELDTPHDCPYAGRQSADPTSWSMRLDADGTTLVGTTVNGCDSAIPCTDMFTGPSYVVRGTR